MNDYEPKRKPVGDLFRQNRRLIIPRFQRSYEWRDANIQDFYADFMATSGGALSFLGNIVVDASDPTRYEVIDGQQRLITLTILYAAIRDILREDIGTEQARELAVGINSTFLKMGTSFSGGQDMQYKLTPSRDLEEFFTYYIQDGGEASRKQFKTSGKPSHKHVANAYKLFRKLITDEKLSGGHAAEEKIEFLRRSVERLENVTLIVIEIYDQNAAYAIFESFNAKRVDLSVADLVKNYYFSKLHGSDETVQASMDRWDKIVTDINEFGKVDRFLHYYFQSKEGRFPKSLLYREVRKEIDKTGDGSKFIKDLEDAVKIYTQLKDSNGEFDNDPMPYEWVKKVEASLEGLNEFRVEQCFIFLLSLMTNRHKLTPKFIAKIIELIENFTFVYSKIENGQANVLESIYGAYAKRLFQEDPERPEIYGGQIYESLRKEFKKYYPNYDTFEAKFKELDYESPQDKRLIKYIFGKTEVYNSNHGTMLGAFSNIDHIFPQNPPTGVRPLKNKHKIGNLLPIDRTTNSSIGNQLPQEKEEIYKNILYISQVKEYLDFSSKRRGEVTDESIMERGSEMAGKAYNRIWSIEK